MAPRTAAIPMSDQTASLPMPALCPVVPTLRSTWGVSLGHTSFYQQGWLLSLIGMTQVSDASQNANYRKLNVVVTPTL